MSSVTVSKLRDLLSERILVLDGSWGVERGGTHGSPASPLLHRCAEKVCSLGLPPGKARLRPQLVSAPEKP
jgi:hypothetical protein